MTDTEQPEAPQAPKRIRTTGHPGIAWQCEPVQGGCGMQGIVPGAEAVQHWGRGGKGEITCRCGAVIVIGKPEPSRIVTPAQHAAQVVRGAR